MRLTLRGARRDLLFFSSLDCRVNLDPVLDLSRAGPTFFESAGLASLGLTLNVWSPNFSGFVLYALKLKSSATSILSLGNSHSQT